MGDMIDRGYDDKKVLEWIQQTQAAHPNEWIQLLGLVVLLSVCLVVCLSVCLSGGGGGGNAWDGNARQ